MGIWDILDAKYLLVPEEYRLSKDEGNTPLTEISIGFNTKVSVKREDLNPAGSHKDRGLAYEISYHLSKGHKDFVISSSGNSAISAFNLIKYTDLNLTIFLPDNTPESKLSRLSSLAQIDHRRIREKYPNIQVFITPKALSESDEYAHKNNSFLLRGSKDPIATTGYTTIATELSKNIKNISDIFIPTSSGTTLMGIYQGFEDLIEKNEISSLPRIHVCQTTKVNIFAREFDDNFLTESNSSVHSIIDRIGHRFSEVVSAIKRSDGAGWVINEDMVRSTLTELQQIGANYISNEGAVAVASVKKALSHGYKLNNIVVINTGYNDEQNILPNK